ncbi:MAG: Arm DNA-binding domain-containing protein [Segetibacter sp.]
MLEESFGLLFYLKKPKNYLKGTLPIYLRITVNGLTKALSLNRGWEKTRWNSYALRPVGTKEDAKELAMYLDSLQVRVYQAKRQILEDGEQITAGGLMDLVSGKYQRGKMLLKIFLEHNERIDLLH